MYKIFIRGEDDPVIVNDEQGQKIQAMLSNSAIASNQIISVKQGSGSSITFRKGEIKRLKSDGDPARYISKHIADTKTEYMQERQRILAMTIEERSKREELFLLAWWAVTGLRDAPESAKIDLYRTQEEFFTLHPQRIHLNGIELKSVIERHAPLNPAERSSPWVSAAMRVVESTIYEDLYQVTH